MAGKNKGGREIRKPKQAKPAKAVKDDEVQRISPRPKPRGA